MAAEVLGKITNILERKQQHPNDAGPSLAAHMAEPEPVPVAAAGWASAIGDTSGTIQMKTKTDPAFAGCEKGAMIQVWRLEGLTVVVRTVLFSAFWCRSRD